MRKMLEKVPQACHYIYFHIEDDKEINKVWNYLTPEYKKDAGSAICTLEPRTSSIISISLAIGDESGAFLSCFQDQ